MERENMTLEQYRSSKVNPVRKYAVNNSYGVYDYYKYYRHNRPKDRSYYKMNEYQYYKLIRTVNEYLIDLLFKDSRVSLPNHLGEIIIRKSAITVKIENGKVKTNRPINWEATIRLWFEDPEAERNKTLVRWEPDELYGIEYKKNGAIFPNKSFYDLQILRRIKQRLSSLLAEKTYDTPFFIDGTVENIKKLYNG